MKKLLALALSLLLVLCAAAALAEQQEVTLADYLAGETQTWFVTGKTDYTVEAMMVSVETSFHNDLEVTDYTATDDGVSVVLRGTVGEQWVSKLSKVMTTYTLPDGSPVTEETFAVKDTFVTLRTISALGTNFAMYVPLDVSVTVETAWGDVLHTNLDNAPHGQGDFLVCRVGEDGQPDLGTMVSGSSENGISAGVWQSETLGLCDVYLWSDTQTVIVMQSPGQTLVFNYLNEAETKAVYEAFLEEAPQLGAAAE